MTPVDTKLPRFDYRTRDGIVALREAFVACFFLPRGEKDNVAAISDAMSHYLSLADVPAVFGVYDEDDTLVADSPAAILACLRGELTSVGRNAFFRVRDSTEPGSGYGASYFHLDAGKRNSPWPHAVAGLNFIFPYEYGGPEIFLRLRDFADFLSDRLSFSYGYIAPCFLFDDGVTKGESFGVIKGLAKRYRCFDIPDLILDCFEVGDGPKGAYWGNYLSASLLEQIGGVAHVRASLASFDIRLSVLRNGAASLYLNPLPISGDVNRQEDVSAYSAASVLFSSRLRPRTIPFLGFSDEDMADWMWRFGRHEIEDTDGTS